MNIKLTLFFDGAFWSALFERIDVHSYAAAKVVFPTEPSNEEMLAYILSRYNTLRFSPAIKVDNAHPRKINPKRLQRLVHKETMDAGIGTKAQKALKLEQETKKAQRTSLSKVKKAEAATAKFELRQDKKKEKHKGH
ncbi:MAG: YjdF family protein [Pelosinus sp.]|nr:YjdF family protein [Pelosinus sp.]